jgi:hypothetical protein
MLAEKSAKVSRVTRLVTDVCPCLQKLIYGCPLLLQARHRRGAGLAAREAVSGEPSLLFALGSMKGSFLCKILTEYSVAFDVWFCDRMCYCLATNWF